MKYLTLITYLGMIAMNALANIIPINKITTGQVSDKHFNLFAPAAITFSIWLVIYIMVGWYTAYQLKEDKQSQLVKAINPYFMASSLLNTAWIVCWHYEWLLVALVLIIGILVCLLKIVLMIKAVDLNQTEKVKIKYPFSVYAGWLTVATIANTTTYLVSINWSGFGISEVAWTSVIIIVGLLIGGFTSLYNKDIFYALVIYWAYTGIFIKHTSEAGFDKMYPQVITSVVVSLIVLFVIIAYLLNKKFRLVGK